MGKLVNCSVCGQEVASDSNSCPKCGHNVARELLSLAIGAKIPFLKNMIGTIGCTSAIIGMFFSFTIGFTGNGIGLGFSILAIILSVVGLFKKPRGIAVIGFVLSLLISINIIQYFFMYCR